MDYYSFILLIYIYIFKKLISDKAISTNLECRYCICSSSPSHQTNLIIIRTSSILSNHSNGKLVIFHILNNVYYVYITNCSEKERERTPLLYHGCCHCFMCTYLSPLSLGACSSYRIFCMRIIMHVFCTKDREYLEIWNIVGEKRDESFTCFDHKVYIYGIRTQRVVFSSFIWMMI